MWVIYDGYRYGKWNQETEIKFWQGRFVIILYFISSASCELFDSLPYHHQLTIKEFGRLGFQVLVE